MSTSKNHTNIITPLLISILLLVSGKLKPLKPFYHQVSRLSITLQRPVLNLRQTFSRQRNLLTSLPQTHFTNLSLQAENSQLKTQNLLFKNKLQLQDQETLSWKTLPLRIIKVGSIITATTKDIDRVKLGMPVVQSTNLIGLVKDINGPIINILSLTHKQTILSVQTDSGIQAELVFKDQTLQLTNLTDQVIPQEKSTIFTLPTEKIPEGLIIGHTLDTLTTPNDPVQRVKVKTSINLNTLTSPHIIISL
jgi:hypothetical protein